MNFWETLDIENHRKVLVYYIGRILCVSNTNNIGNHPSIQLELQGRNLKEFLRKKIYILQMKDFKP